MHEWKKLVYSMRNSNSIKLVKKCALGFISLVTNITFGSHQPFGKTFFASLTLPKKYPYLEFSGPSGPTEIFRISPYSVRMPEKFDQKNSKYRHFSRNDRFLFCHLKENKFKHNFQDSVSSSFWNWRKFWTFLTK